MWPSIKSQTRPEADGTEVKVEVSEDVEQSEKLQAIIDLLVAAGYFRARIKGLSPFDKVVGGMTWCIESCNVDVDVDLLFQENLTIGQKISLTEKIVIVLPKMKCPHVIEPHQIQGLDFIHIFPVIQWLVKRSMEFRQEMAAFVRTYAVIQFNKNFPITSDDIKTKKTVLGHLNIIKDSYGPRRYYRRKNTAQTEIDSLVQLTILEYGHPGEVQNLNDSKCENSLEIQNSQENSFDYDDLDEQDVEKLKIHYKSLQLELKDSNLKHSEESKKISVEVQKEKIIRRNKRAKEVEDSLKESIEEHSNLLQQIKTKQQEANETLKELEQADDIEDAEKLVVQSENIRQKEIQFREQCQKELAKLQKMITEAKTSKSPQDESEINKESEDVKENIRRLRLQLAKKNRIVGSLQRELDESPNRAEMAQYQRRFLELYNQVSAKHKETKQYYTLFNTLEDIKLYMRKELSLLNSISESYPETTISSHAKEDFLTQLQNIVDSVQQSKIKVEQKLSGEKKNQARLNSVLLGLIEQQRMYFNAVRQLMIECQRQEILNV